MIIHAYLTNGFFPWAKFFMESYKFHNGVDKKIILSTFDLNKEQIDSLYNTYPNLEVQNSTFNIEQMSKKSGVPFKTLLKYKDQIERKHVNEKNKVWKLMVAGDSRIKCVRDIVKSNMNEDYIVHCDIDMYIRSPLNDLFEFIKDYDIAMRLRLDSKINRKVWITIQCYKPSKISLDFLNRWIKYIDDVKPLKRVKGYGQTSCYYAYKETKNSCKFGNLPNNFVSAQRRPDDFIWSANTHAGKTKNLQIFKDDFRKMKRD
jgi:hypothetical protein